MLITVDRAEFLAAIKRATAIAPSDFPLDVLKGVLLETDSARKMLTVTSTNLEVSLVEQLPCSAQEDGALVYSARTLGISLTFQTRNTRRQPLSSAIVIRWIPTWICWNMKTVLTLTRLID